MKIYHIFVRVSSSLNWIFFRSIFSMAVFFVESPEIVENYDEAKMLRNLNPEWQSFVDLANVVVSSMRMFSNSNILRIINRCIHFFSSGKPTLPPVPVQQQIRMLIRNNHIFILLNLYYRYYFGIIPTWIILYVYLSYKISMNSILFLASPTKDIILVIVCKFIYIYIYMKVCFIQILFIFSNYDYYCNYHRCSIILFWWSQIFSFK